VGAQTLAVAVPGAVVPSALSGHCFVIRHSDQPARDENLFIVRVSPPADAAGDALRMVTVSRFLRSQAHAADGESGADLFDALEELIPGAGEQAAFQQVLGPAALTEHWGRPAAAVRYAPESRDWLGRRGVAHEVGWPALYVVGDWTYPGRLVADVVEGAMEVADTIIAGL
jgi:phytoene dehydrogenase-like protein